MPNREQMEQALPIMNSLKKAMNEVAAEIRKGKYETADEAQQAMGIKMASALGAPGGAPGQGPDAGEDAGEAPDAGEDAGEEPGAEEDVGGEAAEDDAEIKVGE